MGVAATLFAVQQLKGIEQRRSGAAQWLPGPRSIGQKEFPFRTITLGVDYNYHYYYYNYYYYYYYYYYPV